MFGIFDGMNAYKVLGMALGSALFAGIMVFIKNKIKGKVFRKIPGGFSPEAHVTLVPINTSPCASHQGCHTCSIQNCEWIYTYEYLSKPRISEGHSWDNSGTCVD